MAASKNFTDLIVWQKAHQFVLTTYIYSKLFPKEEIYGLASQFRRAAISIAANIAEGFKRKTKTEKLRFYNIAQGSLEECRYYCILSQDLDYGNSVALQAQLEEVSKLLNAYMKSILSANY
jgi:four helix bundle protein